MPERVTIGYLDSSNVWHPFGPGADGEDITVTLPTGQTTAALSTPVVDALDVHTQTVNATLAPLITSTALVAVAAAGIRSRQILIRNIGTVTVYIAEGEAATTAKWPLNVGETIKLGTLLAVNGITDAATGSVAVLVEARS